MHLHLFLWATTKNCNLLYLFLLNSGSQPFHAMPCYMSCGEAVSLKPINVYNFYSMFCFCFLLLSLQLESIARARKKSENGQINSFNEFNSIHFIFTCGESFSIWNAICCMKWRQAMEKQQFSNYIFSFSFIYGFDQNNHSSRLLVAVVVAVFSFIDSEMELWLAFKQQQQQKSDEERKRSSQKKHHQIRLINLKQISNFTRFRWRIGQQHQQKYEKNTQHTHTSNK